MVRLMMNKNKIQRNYNKTQLNVKKKSEPAAVEKPLKVTNYCPVLLEGKETRGSDLFWRRRTPQHAYTTNLKDNKFLNPQGTPLGLPHSPPKWLCKYLTFFTICRQTLALSLARYMVPTVSAIVPAMRASCCLPVHVLFRPPDVPHLSCVLDGWLHICRKGTF